MIEERFESYVYQIMQYVKYQENKPYIESILEEMRYTLFKEDRNYIKQLEQENKQLKEINNSIKEVDRKLLERIDKAIECIHLFGIYKDTLDEGLDIRKILKNILEILGEKNE